MKHTQKIPRQELWELYLGAFERLEYFENAVFCAYLSSEHNFFM